MFLKIDNSKIKKIELLDYMLQRQNTIKSFNYKETVEFLIKEKCNYHSCISVMENIKFKDQDFKDKLMFLLIEKGNKIDKLVLYELINHLLICGSNPNTEYDIKHYMYNGNNHWIEAAFPNIILKKEIEGEIKNDDLTTVFVRASCYSYIDIMKLFLKNGVDINCIEGKAIIKASLLNKNDCVKFLLENGADPNLSDGKGLINTGYNGNIDMLKLFLNSKMNCYGYIGKALIEASEHNRVNFVKFVLEMKNRISKEDLNISINSTSDKIEIVKLLLRCGANVNDEGGQCNALETFCLHGQTDDVKFLLDNGANPNTYDCLYYTFGDEESEGEELSDDRIKIIKLLLDYGLNVHLYYYSLIEPCKYIEYNRKGIELIINSYEPETFDCLEELPPEIQNKILDKIEEKAYNFKISLQQISMYHQFRNEDLIELNKLTDPIYLASIQCNIDAVRLLLERKKRKNDQK